MYALANTDSHPHILLVTFTSCILCSCKHIHTLTTLTYTLTFLAVTLTNCLVHSPISLTQTQAQCDCEPHKPTLCELVSHIDPDIVYGLYFICYKLVILYVSLFKYF
jgi:hypothetical protein